MSKVALERPDLFKFSLVRPNRTIAKNLIQRGHEADDAPAYQPNLAVVIRSKNDIIGLKAWLEFINRAKTDYKGRIDVIVVDTESTDGCRELAEKNGAKLVELTQADFTYPKSINKGLEASRDDVELAFITVGHAYPALSNGFSAGTRHFANKKVAGAYGTVLPHSNATLWEKLMLYRVKRYRIQARQVQRPHFGIMGATNAIIRRSVWKELPYDERYAAGAEDGAWAREALSRGYLLVYDPAMTVHHTHGLSFINTGREVVHWVKAYYLKPKAFNQKDMRRRRPDLFS